MRGSMALGPPQTCAIAPLVIGQQPVMTKPSSRQLQAWRRHASIAAVAPTLMIQPVDPQLTVVYPSIQSVPSFRSLHLASQRRGNPHLLPFSMALPHLRTSTCKRQETLPVRGAGSSSNPGSPNSSRRTVSSRIRRLGRNWCRKPSYAMSPVSVEACHLCDIKE
jgi:hypothetical protein